MAATSRTFNVTKAAKLAVTVLALLQLAVVRGAALKEAEQPRVTRFAELLRQTEPDDALQPNDETNGGERRALAAPKCSGAPSWKTSGGNIMLNGNPFRLKGASWFGFETPDNMLHGLWSGRPTMSSMLDFCKKNKINALRIPMSLDLMLDPNTRFARDRCFASDCPSTKSWDALSLLCDRAAERGIMIVLGMHNLNKENKNKMWYDDKHSEADVIKGWVNIVKKFNSKPNFMGIDIVNEPWGATWGMGKSTDWDKAAVRIVKGIKAAVPSFNKLIMIQGVASGNAPSPFTKTDPAYEKFWGSNLDGLYSGKTVDFGSADLNSRLIYAPHYYGPSLTNHAAFNAPNFPYNMKAIWDKQVGFVEGKVKKPVVIGEWGGRNTGQDAKLQKEWVKYMADNCISDSFYWALNPNSADLGGLLTDDWVTPIQSKLDLLKTAQPDPTVISKITATQVCATYGSWANGKTCK